ncbi:MAG: ferritin family protein [Anaeromicrobium sp.]|uniref:ferritin family protein n=1 Tax=Anaeromicrobium sp. TaxID=1929132 RepID=UPI0025E2FF2C|nr:ferritin family protein [Anaeromicrobium sp.]MCT4595438.1 ferritin family protein [Anaeromicrobium sp.]
MIFSNLNELEVLKIAKGIEETGYNFYKSAAEKFKDLEVKEMLEQLADEEMEHMITFQRIYERVKEKSLNEDVNSFDEETTAYLKAISETSVFNVNNVTGGAISLVRTPADVIRMGMQAEKDSILFYETVLKHTKEELTQKTLRRLIKEEIKHLHEFRNLLEEVK